MNRPSRDLALSESGFLFDPRTGSTYSLNPTGTLLLRDLIDGISPDRLIERLLATFRVDSETAARDVERFLFRLRGLGLMEGRKS
ncbi:MAG: HPr-rel-A system PqqD family peptide chaperone [bacterium]|nr:HPr-rel-A system PqqD family peptide chaperone [bacterium]